MISFGIVLDPGNGLRFLLPRRGPSDEPQVAAELAKLAVPVRGRRFFRVFAALPGGTAF